MRRAGLLRFRAPSRLQVLQILLTADSVSLEPSQQRIGICQPLLGSAPKPPSRRIHKPDRQILAHPTETAARSAGFAADWGTQGGTLRCSYNRLIGYRLAMPISRTHLAIIAAFASVYIIWGSTYLALAVALQSIPPFALMAGRCLLGG